jgi:hypothetical protein
VSFFPEGKPWLNSWFPNARIIGSVAPLLTGVALVGTTLRLSTMLRLHRQKCCCRPGDMYLRLCFSLVRLDGGLSSKRDGRLQLMAANCPSSSRELLKNSCTSLTSLMQQISFVEIGYKSFLSHGLERDRRVRIELRFGCRRTMVQALAAIRQVDE